MLDPGRNYVWYLLFNSLLWRRWYLFPFYKWGIWVSVIKALILNYVGERGGRKDLGIQGGYFSYLLRVSLQKAVCGEWASSTKIIWQGPHIWLYLFGFSFSVAFILPHLYMSKPSFLSFHPVFPSPINICWALTTCQALNWVQDYNRD